ncbi:MAG: hypothetical protein IKV59_02955 [Lachnospiraceae bacterium]|nr:hypothetical protein [Lachnospiraceae bacterium]
MSIQYMEVIKLMEQRRKYGRIGNLHLNINNNSTDLFDRYIKEVTKVTRKKHWRIKDARNN